MYESMVDIHLRRLRLVEEKRKKKQDKNIMSASALTSEHFQVNSVVTGTIIAANYRHFGSSYGAIRPWSVCVFVR